MDTEGQLRNLRDFLLVYNRMTEICFQRCTTNFNYRNLTMDEEHCVDSCAGKLIRSNHRLMGTYVKLMPAMVQRRMEELESKAAAEAKAAEAVAPVDPLAGALGTPETTTMVSSPTAPAGSVAEPTLSGPSAVPAPATSGTETPEHAYTTTAELPAVAPPIPSLPIGSSIPAQGSLSSAVAAIPVETLALKQVGVDNSSTSPVPGLQSTVGTKQDKTS
ncbi:hypothetical protein NFI96_015433 [Prochilodus magdalenae]|nr:hypothetical protein NFI96_015433 [Prochilodus magdalenae]